MKRDLMSSVAHQPLHTEAAVADRLGLVAVDDPLLNAREAARDVGLSLPAFWRCVSSKRLPAPVYPAPRAPRWYRSELRAAVKATRALPADAKASRRAATFLTLARGT